MCERLQCPLGPGWCGNGDPCPLHDQLVELDDQMTDFLESTALDVFVASGAASGEDGGDEIDLVASYKINKYLSLLAKYGSYDSDGGVGGAGAVDKDMFTFEMNFTY